MLSDVMLKIIEAGQNKRLDLTGSSFTEWRNNNFFLSAFPRSEVNTALRRLLDAGVLYEHKKLGCGSYYNGLFDGVEILNDTFDTGRLCNIARTSFYAADTPEENEERDTRMISALMQARHDSVFEFADITLRVTLPIYVARQIMRYRTGSYMEASRRRIEPKKRRGRSEVDRFYNLAVDKYRELIKAGYKKEDARAVLPVDDETTLVIRWSYRSLAHIFDERLTAATQPITRGFISRLYLIVKALHPDFIAAYEKSRGKA